MAIPSATRRSALVISPDMVTKLSYNVLKDFHPVAQVANNQLLLAAAPATPFKTVREVIYYAKAIPGKLFYASSGNVIRRANAHIE